MRTLILATIALVATATAAHADIRICEISLRGPAGQHEIYIEMQDGQMTYGEAVWAPPRQNARANVEFPRIELNYGIQDITTGSRTSLRYIHVIHGVRMDQVRGRTAEISLAPYGQPGESRPWSGFAQARDPNNLRSRNSDGLGGGVGFSSSTALGFAQSAPQLETRAVTDLGEVMSTGVFLMVHRPALDALFDHAFQQLRPSLEDPQRQCRSPRYDEHLRSGSA